MTRRSWIAWCALALVMATLGVGLSVVLNRVETNAADLRAAAAELEQEQTESAELREIIITLSADVHALRDQITAAGEEPIAPEPEERVEELPDLATPPPVVQVVPRGPTAAQVEAGIQAVLARDPDLIGQPLVAAVAAHLAANPPAPGEPGADATMDQILVAVSTVCADDACDGPPVTDEQIEATLAAYCNARGECIGPMGPMGPEGPEGKQGIAGKDGRGIVDVDCDGDDLVLTFDQEPLTDIVEGGCRRELVDPPPDPDPTEVP